MINCGIIMTGYGIITDANNSKNILFFPRNWSFAKAKAAKLDVNVPITVTEIATIKLLLIPDNKGPIDQISAYLANEIVSGIHTGGKANTSSFDLSEVENIHSSGATMKIAPTLRKAKTKILVILFFFFSDIGSALTFFLSAIATSIIKCPFLLLC
jgi:hypothetical protein